jgi:mono/diheme cytochrome c family protein
MTISKTTGLAIAGLLLAAAQAVAAPPALFTQAQQTAGAGVYTQNCAECHGDNLEGGVGPALSGAAFAPAAKKDTVHKIFKIITTKMPLGQPGSLSHDEYAEVMAYILSKNGFPAGSTALDYNATLTSAVPFVSQ